MSHFNKNHNYNTNQNFRLNKGSKKVANAHVATTETQLADSDGPATHYNNQNVSLTKEYGQLVSHLQYFQSRGGRSSANFTSGAVNFAGIVACTSFIDFCKLSCECFKNKVNSWIIDSRASNHMTFSKSLLTSITTLPFISNTPKWI